MPGHFIIVEDCIALDFAVPIFGYCFNSFIKPCLHFYTVHSIELSMDPVVIVALVFPLCTSFRYSVTMPHAVFLLLTNILHLLASVTLLFSALDLSVSVSILRSLFLIHSLRFSVLLLSLLLQTDRAF